MKKCNKCGIEKELSEFRIMKKYYLGQCKSCEKEYYHNNKEKFKKYKEKWNKENYKNNKEKFKKYNKEWNLKNKEKINKSNKDFYYNLKNDSILKIRVKISNSLSQSFIRKNLKRNRIPTEKLLGCDIPHFKKYIESKFEPWMDWNNYGKYNGKYNYGWDYDHIIPISEANSREEIIKLNHYSNYQPLCSHINRDIKGV